MERIVLHTKCIFPKTEIYFGLDQLSSVCKAKKGAIIVDETIGNTHGKIVQNILGYELISLPNKKTRAAKEKLEDELFKRKLGKDALLVALGGGVITDLVGFTASTYMRGVSLILIPTTLLAMVDAAIGGKTGIDTPFGKNLIGTFYLPEAIFIELDFLKTLPKVEFINGLSEIFKMGLIYDAAIWNTAFYWENEMPKVVRASILAKCKIVENDFEEKTGFRRILNFGHTVGHALEFLSHYRMPHGEAVALGCMAESYLSHILGYLSKEEFETILTLYKNLGYTFKEIDPKTFKEAMDRDKKSKEGEARFVLIDKIGHAIPFDGQYCQFVPENKINEVIEWMHYV